MDLNRLVDNQYFIFLLDLEVKRAQRYQNFLSVLNLEFLPLVERTNGDGLDDSYEKLSKLLVEETRDSDIIGSSAEKDKFKVLLPYADAAGAEKVRKRLEKVFEYYNFKNIGYDITIKQACFPVNGTSPDELMIMN